MVGFDFLSISSRESQLRSGLMDLRRVIIVGDPEVVGGGQEGVVVASE